MELQTIYDLFTSVYVLEKIWTFLHSEVYIIFIMLINYFSSSKNKYKIHFFTCLRIRTTFYK